MTTSLNTINYHIVVARKLLFNLAGRLYDGRRRHVLLINAVSGEYRGRARIYLLFVLCLPATILLQLPHGFTHSEGGEEAVPI